MAGRRKKSPGTQELTPLEVQMMQVLWRDGPSSVQHVRDQVAGDLAYTTVQTVLNSLHQKGKARRKLRGRAFEYRAAVAQQAALRNAVRDFIDRMFSGSAEGLVMNLIQTRQLDAKSITALAAAEQESEDE